MMTFDPSLVSNWVVYLTIWGGAFLAAFWISLVVWAARDVRTRTRDPLARLMAILVVAFFFLPGLVVYMILRPPHTLEEEYQRTLEEEALLQSIEDSQLCPGCGRRARELWIICPNCQTKLKKPCHHCGQLMELPWNICAFCGTPAPGMRREDTTLDDALRSIPILEPETELELEPESDPQPEPEDDPLVS